MTIPKRKRRKTEGAEESVSARQPLRPDGASGLHKAEGFCGPRPSDWGRAREGGAEMTTSATSAKDR